MMATRARIMIAPKNPCGTIRLVVTSFDPRTARAVEDVGPETSADDVARLCANAVVATAQLEALGRRGRAAMLRAMADALEADRDLLVEVADRETALGSQRLNGELTRVIRLPETRKVFIELGIEPLGTSPEEFGQYLRAEIARWSDVMRAHNIRGE